MTLYSLDDFRLSPSIMLNETDNRQLTVLALAGTGHTTDDADDLLHELERARVVADRDLPHDIVRMGSLVHFRSGDGDDARETIAQLVYPEEADIASRKVSVLTPVGTALIGLRSGQSITFATRDGRSQMLTVLRVDRPAPDGDDDPGPVAA
jgi:regulator of nucleoside diphosphate kinase